MKGVVPSTTPFHFMNQPWKLFQVAAIIILILLYSGLTYKRNYVWKDDVTLWSDVVKKSPNKARVHLALGIIYNEKGLYEQAESESGKALSLNPHFAHAHYVIGLSLQKRGLLDESIVRYKKVIQLDQ